MIDWITLLEIAPFILGVYFAFRGLKDFRKLRDKFRKTKQTNHIYKVKKGDIRIEK